MRFFFNHTVLGPSYLSYLTQNEARCDPRGRFRGRRMCLQLRLLGLALPVEPLELRARLLGDVLDEVVDLAAALVGDGLLLALGQPVDCGESLWMVVH